MRVPQDMVSSWIGYWGYMASQASSKWFDATRQIEDGTYDTKKLFSDVTSFWLGAASGWWAAAQRTDNIVPTIFIAVPSDNEAGPSSGTPVFAPSIPAGNPELVWLGAIGTAPTSGALAAANCEATLSDDRYELTVTLKNLPTTLGAATYHALVQVGGVLLANVYIHVKAA
ncbi:MAG: hypothetical protein HY270_13345 [Deltaproteobacteria bacterium]|nr:hypothetical protein [Deltaproteobacteria bacterium]